MARFFEDLEQGQEFYSVGRTVTESDIMSFAGVSGDFNRLHTDERWVRTNTDFDGRIAHGLLILAISSGISTPGLDDLSVLAYMNVERKMIGPTYPGDTVHVRHIVAMSRPSSSRPGAGVVELDVEVVKNGEVTVQTGKDVLLIARRDSHA